MFYRFMFLGILFAIALIMLELLLPYLKYKYRLDKEEKQKKIEHKKFVKNIKELEIK
ncbi:MAG: hypothetical protein IJH39_00680 [Clostridia bacterium]|nr:hypothetical protein [Clostridia bacterium]